MDWRTACRKAIDYFYDNEDDFNRCVEALDSYNGFLDEHGGRYWPMWEFDSYMSGMTASQILDDIDPSFDTGDSYFIQDPYSGITSCNTIDYSDLLTTDTITDIYNHRDDIEDDIPSYVIKLFDSFLNDYEDDEEDEEDES